MDSNQLFSDQQLQEIMDKDLLELLGAGNMTPEEKAKLYEKMAETVQKRVLMRVDDTLNDQERAEWLKLLEEGDKVKMDAFLAGKNVDIAKMLIEEAMIYKMEIVSLAKK